MKKIRIGMIGAGNRGGWFIRNKFSATRWNGFAEPKDFEMAAVVEPSDYWLNFACPEGLRGIRRETDWRKMIQADDIDVVAIMTPDHMHEEMAVASFKAAKHVFCEKPLALTPKGCSNVIRAMKKAKKGLIIGFVLRYAPLYVKAKELIEKGAIGKLRGVWMLHSVAAASDYYFHDWHGVEKNVNSLLLQKGSHDLDIINWMVGAPPTRVAAFAGLQYFGGNMPNDLTCPKCKLRKTCPEFMSGPRNQCAFRKEIDVNDNHVVIIDYKNGVKANYNECHFTSDDNREYIFIGTEGKMWMTDRGATVRVEKRWKRQPSEVYNVSASGGHGGGDERLLEDLVNLVRKGAKPVAGPDSGFYSILLADGAARSIREGRVIDLSKAKC